MPGANCSIVGCSTSRYKSVVGQSSNNKDEDATVGIFCVPCSKPNNDKQEKWRQDFLAAIKLTREEDSNFKNLIAKGHVWACEKHFKKDEYSTRKYFIYFYKIHIYIVQFTHTLPI